ncbi:hypothetical protein [Porphyromonas endodontalis]|uniref:hypothetical protein n=1 Tax=Porphyromonas endodontalis TaxID=28124 RepID=UPI0028E9ADC8|nr:hypothetical protein [Porphyromonas endodontalis]
MEQQDWRTYTRELEEKINVVLEKRSWEKTIPQKAKNLLPLFRHLTIAINSFLESDKSDLFIKIPVEKLVFKTGKNDHQKEVDTHNLLSGTVLGCLATATSVVFKKNIHPNIESHILGDDAEFKENDTFCCRNLREDRKYIYARAVKEDVSKPLRLKFWKGNNLCYNPEEMFNNYCDQDSFIRISDIPSQKRNGFNKIEKAVVLVDNLPSLNQEYGSATLVTAYTPENETIPINNTLLPLPYNCLNEFIAKESSKEILVFVGDKTYQKEMQSIYNREAKKLIFIGSEFPYSKVHQPKCYELSYRELHECIGQKNGFTLPKSCILEFPWLERAKNELEKILSDYDNGTIEPILKKKVINYALAHMTSPDFDEETLQRMKDEYDEYWLYNVTGASLLEEGLGDRILDWLQDLSFEGEVNPKKAWLDENKREKFTFIPNTRHIQKKSIKKPLGEGNSFVIGTLSIFNNDISSSALGYILRYQINPQITVLYYKEIEASRSFALKRYIESEDIIYRSELRKNWTLAWSNQTQELSNETSYNGDDLQKLLDESDYVSNRQSEAQVFEMTCIDGSSFTSQGDILLWNDGKGYWDRSSLGDDDLQGEKRHLIRYYKQPQNFGSFIEKNRRETIEHYSKLWQKRFREEVRTQLVQKEEKEILRELGTELNVSDRLLKAYITPDSPNRFLRSHKDMNSMCKWLQRIGRLSDSERIAVLKARRSNSQNVSIGRALKSDLLEYSQTGVISESLNRQGVDIEALLKEAIIEVETVKISKKE